MGSARTAMQRRRGALKYSVPRTRHAWMGEEPYAAVLSLGAGSDRRLAEPRPGDRVLEVAAALEARGLRSVVGRPGGPLRSLTARQNPQGQFTNGEQGPGPGWFLHIELESRLRRPAVRGDYSGLALIRDAIVSVPWRSNADV